MTDRRVSVAITSQPRFDELVDHLRATGQFALDTEFVSEDTFEPELGLIQVATRERLATIDPLAVADLKPLWEVVLDPNIEVVMHAPSEDLRILKHKTGQLPARVVDVQRAAGLIGLNYPSSLGNLTAACLRVTLDSRETRSDWRRRPLSDAQLRYALDDVRYLHDLYDDIRAKLDKLGRRAWAEEEYRALLQRIDELDDQERWRRLPGLNQLNRRGLEVARRLWEWRRDRARHTNQPLRRVMRDDVLVAIAKRQPVSRADLEALRDIQRTGLRTVANELVALVQEARAVADHELPARLELRDEGRTSGMVVNVLMAVLQRCCSEQQLAASLVGTASDLRELVHWQTSHDDAPLPTLLRGWRQQACGDLLLEVLAGRRSLRITDPAGEVPLAIDDVRPGDRS
jgi:ribonuclease D